jgi:hypothetical protein
MAVRLIRETNMGFRQVVEAPSQIINGTSGVLSWLSVLWRKIGQVEEWIEIGGSGGEPAFENSWANLGGAYETVAFYKDPFGRVHLKGALDTGTSGTTAFTLPVGYRPAATIRVSTASTGNHYTEITSAGEVQPQRSGSAAAYLDGASFRAEQ